MQVWVIVTLRTMLAIGLLASVLVQIVVPFVFSWDLDGNVPPTAGWSAAYVIVFIATLQAIAICVWQLLTLVHRQTVFSLRAVPYVNVIVGAILSAAALVAVRAALLVPGDMAPGVVGILCGAALGLVAVALVVVVMRTLLLQAIARETEVVELRTELSEVV